MGFYTRTELLNIGFQSIGENVKISRHASIYRPENIIIKSHVRIDDFCILSASDHGIEIGNYVHIANMCSIIGQERTIIGDYSGLSGRVSIYTSSDSYNGDSMTNPMVPEKLTNVRNKSVSLGKHVIVGSGSIILPGSILNNGVAVGAMSLIHGNLQENSVYSGIPAQHIRKRKTTFYQLEKDGLENGLLFPKLVEKK